jgi:hypothetical protein
MNARNMLECLSVIDLSSLVLSFQVGLETPGLTLGHYTRLEKPDGNKHSLHALVNNSYIKYYDFVFWLTFSQSTTSHGYLFMKTTKC